MNKMTMDMYQRPMRAERSPASAISIDTFKMESSSPAPSTTSLSPPVNHHPPKPPTKRSFDVAFLMAPDDLSKKRHHKAPTTVPVPEDAHIKRAHKFLSDYADLPFESLPISGQLRYQTNPLSLTISRERAAPDNHYPGGVTESDHIPAAFFASRSAFTKVESTLRTPPIAMSPSSVCSTNSNRSAMSPDLTTYQDSLSPQPAAFFAAPPLSSNRSGGSGGKLTPPFMIAHSPNPMDKQQPPHHKFCTNDFLESAVAAAAAAAAAAASTIDKKHHHHHNLKFPPPSVAGVATSNGTKSSLPFQAGHFQPLHPEAAMPPYGFPMAAFPFGPPPTPSCNSTVAMFPSTAAAAAALLPTSLAALTLPAQNVCAKCNMHFRMTSDLVYHMRSHHKNENPVVDPYKRRRDQDKLKCPVCNESFRERHHLTRHMTAHQDKEDEAKAAAAAAAAANCIPMTGKDFVDVNGIQRTITGSAK